MAKKDVAQFRVAPISPCAPNRAALWSPARTARVAIGSALEVGGVGVGVESCQTRPALEMMHRSNRER